MMGQRKGEDLSHSVAIYDAILAHRFFELTTWDSGEIIGTLLLPLILPSSGDRSDVSSVQTLPFSRLNPSSSAASHT